MDGASGIEAGASGAPDPGRAFDRNRFGLFTEVVDTGRYERSVERFRTQGIVLPTFAQLADPSLIPADIRSSLAGIDRDAADRSTLATTEELVAQFPDIDQNRGIRRAIPAVYQGHSTDLRIESVTDETGAPRSYDTSRDGDFLVLTIAVPEGQYVHGEQHYVIRYSQRDVTRHFEDTGRDEWYWDVNGTGWAQPFGVVDATVHLGPGLGAAYQQGACYFGPEGSTSRCDLVATNDIDLVFAAGEMRALYDRLPPGIGAEYGEIGTDLIDEIRRNVRTGDVVMIKGSNASRMAAVVKALLDVGATAENE